MAGLVVHPWYGDLFIALLHTRSGHKHEVTKRPTAYRGVRGHSSVVLLEGHSDVTKGGT